MRMVEREERHKAVVHSWEKGGTWEKGGAGNSARLGEGRRRGDGHVGEEGRHMGGEGNGRTVGEKETVALFIERGVDG